MDIKFCINFNEYKQVIAEKGDFRGGNTVECLNCKKDISVEEIEKYTTLTCNSCGCIMKCLDINDYISRWRVMNPFDIEDRRNSN